MSYTSTIKRHKNGKSECTVTFNEDTTASAKEKAIKKLGAAVKISGFRPGHAPMEKIMEAIKPEAITEETIRGILPETLAGLVKEHSLTPIIQPSVQLEKADPLTITVVFIEAPAVQTKGVKKIKVPKKEVKVDQKDIDRMVEYILKQHQTISVSTEPAKETDRITLNFYGEDENGQEIENTRSTNYSVVIGSKQLIPGFEDALIGLQTGEKKSFNVVFPAKYQVEHLQNKPAIFHAECLRIENVLTPELTDEFAKNTLQTESKKAFLAEIESSMKIQEEEVEMRRRENELFDALATAFIVDLPDELIAEEVRHTVDEFAEQLSKQHMTLQGWLDATKKTAEDAMKEFKANAKKRLTLRLGMQTLVAEENIIVTDDEIQTAIQANTERAEGSASKAAYSVGSPAYEQLVWQKKVEKVIAQLLS